jgi:N-acetylglutamate synthase-like GNAT family acetyltransferase
VGKPAAESNPFLIRAARPAEAEAIVALLQRAFGVYRGKLQPESSALLETADMIRTAMKTGTILLAERAGRILGCVSVQRKGDCAYAGRLAVEPMEQGIGVGRALLAAAEALARQMGLGRLRVDVRLKLRDNRAFFRALGFVEGAERCHPGFRSPTYIELEKTLI